MRRILTAILAMFITLAVATPAGAITNGEIDGDAHPNVGAMVAEFDAGEPQLFCTGTLIAADVVLTASHCTAALEFFGIGPEEIGVTFDSEFVGGVSTVIPGTYVTNPDWGHDTAHAYDVAVVLLDHAAAVDYPGIEPVQLPTLNLLDELGKGLRDETFTNVGYGAQDRVNGGGPPFFPGDTIRRNSVSSFNALTKNWLRLSQNPSKGDGGTCYGDSGGPQFLGDSDLQVSVTVTGDVPCRSTNTAQRLDIGPVRDFLGQYVTLP